MVESPGIAHNGDDERETKTRDGNNASNVEKQEGPQLAQANPRTVQEAERADRHDDAHLRRPNAPGFQRAAQYASPAASIAPSPSNVKWSGVAHLGSRTASQMRILFSNPASALRCSRTCSETGFIITWPPPPCINRPLRALQEP